jgi:hypothetical protein
MTYIVRAVLVSVKQRGDAATANERVGQRRSQ